MSTSTGLLGTALTAFGGIVGSYITARVTTAHFKRTRREQKLAKREDLHADVASWIYRDRRFRSRAHGTDPMPGQEREEHEKEGTRIAGALESEFGRELADKFFEYMNEPSDKLAVEIREDLERKTEELPSNGNHPWPRRLTTFFLALIAVSSLVLAFVVFNAWGEIEHVLAGGRAHHAIAQSSQKAQAGSNNAALSEPGAIPSKNAGRTKKKKSPESQTSQLALQTENSGESLNEHGSSACKSCVPDEGSQGPDLAQGLHQAAQGVLSVPSDALAAAGKVLNAAQTLTAPLISVGPSSGPSIINIP